MKWNPAASSVQELAKKLAIMFHKGIGPDNLSEDYAVKATTLAGYGITDAYTKIESDNKFGLLANAVIETGSNANGTWRKWADGTLECWGTKTFTSVALTIVWGGVICVSPPELVTWPISFTVIESANINVIARTPEHFVPALIDFVSSYQGGFYFWKPSSSTILTYDSITVGFYAKGRWK